MKTLWRFGVHTALTLIVSVACFGQELHSNESRFQHRRNCAPVTDPQLINPWGLSRASGSPWWISDQATGFSTLYNGPGVKQTLIVTIPPSDPTNKNTPIGSPTGTMRHA